jgi:phage-related minor tail protein
MTILPDRIIERDEPTGDFPRTADRVRTSTSALGVSAASFAKAMSKAFADATTGGKKFDDVLRQLALRLSGMAVSQAFQPLARNLAGGLGDLIGGIFGDTTGGRGGKKARLPDAIGLDRLNAVTPFAAGGVIGAPAYFPLSGGLGLAGEAGPEAVLPLARGSDGRLGVVTNAGAMTAPSVTVHIATPDADSFRRSEAYITGQIARAVARGQRGL